MMINDPPFSPLVRCLPIEAPQPSLEDNRADADRLKQSLARELSKQGVKGG